MSETHPTFDSCGADERYGQIIHRLHVLARKEEKRREAVISKQKKTKTKQVRIKLKRVKSGVFKKKKKEKKNK
jgi:hypothetical protein